jgi:hypothetical protein
MILMVGKRDGSQIGHLFWDRGGNIRVNGLKN